MSKYEIKDAIMLKECMKIVAGVVAKYPQGAGIQIESVPEDIKNAIEYIEEMVKKGV